MKTHRAARPNKMHAADLRDRALILTAIRFSVFRCRGRGVNVREEHDTLASAMASAAGDNRAIVYAITPIGQSVMVPAGYRHR